MLDENVRSRMKGDEKFQSFVREELAALKNSVSVERQTRERDDGEIVDALVSGTMSTHFVVFFVLCCALLVFSRFPLGVGNGQREGRDEGNPWASGLH